MKISYVLAFALVPNLMLGAEETIDLAPVAVSAKIQKSILDEPTKAQIVGKGAILENGDIAKSLLNLSGFTMERKGGGGSEVYYRSQTAARLPVLIDGSTLNGGCGMRMDTPITYISAQNYSSVRIVKGPQDVRYGALISGGIFFDREIARLSKPSFGGNVSVLGGSFRRFETAADVAAGNELGSLEISGGHYQSGDYKSGDGQKMHTHYKRNSVSLVGTLTPTDTTALQLSVDLGDGEAAYADRMRDGVQFDRKSFGLKFEQDVGEHKIRLSSYYHQIDHIMDNFTMRPVVPGTGRGKGYSISHPICDMYGFKLEGELNFDNLTSFIGMGYSQDTFKWRGAGSGMAGVSKAEMDSAVSKPHVKERKVTYKTIYTQNEYVLENDYGLFGGLRLDAGERKLLKRIRAEKKIYSQAFLDTKNICKI
ncbi:TonB-dependent receptor plug domain-containing protein [Campylobacter concisus]|uniref:TonB-dependent receptor plug domain-containing protein n=1 Tax=Campylobacter concisus TaxID=199 RepID=UPI0015E1B055|nr:TonB-dependent receptor plug domain-containing protein [Campylobacter concisus]